MRGTQVHSGELPCQGKDDLIISFTLFRDNNDSDNDIMMSLCLDALYVYHEDDVDDGDNDLVFRS